MEDLDDLSPNKLRLLCEDWAALAYAVKNSFIYDPDFEELISKTGWYDEYVVLRDCSEAVVNTEDLILHRGWLMGQIEQELKGDDGDF